VRRLRLGLALMVVPAIALACESGSGGGSGGPSASGLKPAASPIQHVVVLFQENHSFDNLFGYFCVHQPVRHCDGVVKGKLPNDSTVPLTRAGDIVPNIGHKPSDQVAAFNHGSMNGFANVEGCGPPGRKCYTYYAGWQIPSLASLAANFVLSDHTFEQTVASSWVAHMELVATRPDGFTGWNPVPAKDHPSGPGWGCDSFKIAAWRAPGATADTHQPSCVPKPDGSGPYRPSPVKYVPTIMGRLDAAQRSWKIYAPGPEHAALDPGYAWSICPYFASCLFTDQRSHMVDPGRVITDARAGHLPEFSIVIPVGTDSQHNTRSLIEGDNWIAKVVNAIGRGPDWKTTTVFITYDDCGCFYDHLKPPGSLGIRVPMVIVSPYARPHFTESRPATFASILAYAEHLFGLEPLSSIDKNAYDYSGSFDYSQSPRPYRRLKLHPIPQSSIDYLKKHTLGYEP
jgi:phospholipase C